MLKEYFVYVREGERWRRCGPYAATSAGDALKRFSEANDVRIVERHALGKMAEFTAPSGRVYRWKIAIRETPQKLLALDSEA